MTLVITHSKVSTKPVGNDSSRIYSDSWNANHALTGTVDASQLNSNVVQSVTNDANITGTISAQNLTFAWSGKLGLARGGTNADLSATGGAGNYLKQVTTGAAVTVGTIPASDIASGTALTGSNDTNVTLTLGGTPTTALLKATSITLGWTGTLAASRGGFGADVSAQSGVPLFATGVPTFTGTSGSGNFVRVTSAALITPALGTPSSGVLTSCTGLPLSTGVTGNLSVNNLNSGTSASSTTFWRGDGTWATPSASAGVSSIAGNTGAFTLNSASGLSNTVNDIIISQTPTAWTPVLTCATPGNLAVAYTTQVGRYIKTGKQVTATFNIQTSSFTWTTASGSAQITGLPFAANSTASVIFTGSVNVGGWTRASYTWMTPTLGTGQSLMTLNVSGSGQGSGGDVIGSFPSGGTVVLQGTITYFTD